MRARQHNLDVGVIAKETVRMVLEQAFLVSSYQSRIQLSSLDRTSHLCRVISLTLLRSLSV
jgi:hypothetical protein